ncbi:MAG: ATP-binding cassette domain-containing protein, partial [Pseudomonadota bacterium]
VKLPEKGAQYPAELSGGQKKRIGLARALILKPEIILYDEPTTGLHFEDVNKLLEVLQTLVDQGNTVVVIEHNLDVVKVADWVVDLGPEGGDGGGHIIGTGTPEDLAQVEGSHTGRYLRDILAAKGRIAAE